MKTPNAPSDSCAALDVALGWWDTIFAAAMGDERAAQIRSALVAAVAAEPPIEGTERAFVVASGMNAVYDSFLADGLTPGGAAPLLDITESGSAQGSREWPATASSSGVVPCR